MAITKRIRKSDGVPIYYVDFYDAQGIRVRERSGTKLSVARNLLRSRIGQVQDGVFINPRSTEAAVPEAVTFAQFSERFLSDYGEATPRRKASGYYAQEVRVLVRWFGPRPMREITRSEIDQFAATRRSEVGASTLRKDLTVLGKMLELAAQWDVIDHVPKGKTAKPREPKGSKRYLRPEEWDRLLEVSPPWLRPILTLAVGSGARLKEVVGVKWEEVDIPNRRIHLSADNKTEEPRVIPISPTIAAVLNERGRVRDLRTGQHLYPWVLTDATGNPYTSGEARDRIGKETVRAMKAAGIEGASFRSLRHTAASWMVQAGIPLAKIGAILGHATTQTTLTYAHLTPDHLRDGLDAVDAVMSGQRAATPAPLPETAAEVEQTAWTPIWTPSVSADQPEGANLAQLQQLGR